MGCGGGGDIGKEDVIFFFFFIFCSASDNNNGVSGVGRSSRLSSSRIDVVVDRGGGGEVGRRRTPLLT